MRIHSIEDSPCYEIAYEVVTPGHELALATLPITRIAGISGILGNPRKPFRRKESAYLELLDELLRLKPDLLLVHNGPDVPVSGLRGQACIRKRLEAADPLLVICGHAHWDTPLAELANGTQVLNVDSRCVMLEAP